jgi:hypothetical protein
LVQLVPPDGLPDAAPAVDDDAWSNLVSTQLENVRKTAENWRNGLVATVAAIVGFSVIKGPDDVSTLAHPAAVISGLLLLVALILGLIGTLSSLDAAYGSPKVMTKSEFDNQGGIAGFNLVFATSAVQKLRRAQILTVAALGLLAAAVGVTWYGPRPDSPLVDVSRNGAPDVCGNLVASADGNVDIKPAGAIAIRLHLPDLTKMKAVDTCQ